MSGVLFVVMPFCGAERPQIGVSTLKAQLLAAGIPCNVAYFNLPFAAALGYDDYSWITNNYDYTLFAGEWAFARTLFSDRELDTDGYVRNMLIGKASLSPAQVDRVWRIAKLARPFLDYCLASVDWDRYSIVGFTSTFEQNLGSLALARRIKDRYPDKIIVMGGGNCGGEMGAELHRSFPWLDYVFTGEADLSFPELVRRIGVNDPARADIPGYVRREGGMSVATPAGALIRDLDVLPYPNYDDFFSQLADSGIAHESAAMLQIETARGCWWGAKSHCTFCGLNRDEMTFRVKSAERALDEIEHLARRYRVQYISAVDNIISMQYFHTVLPELKRRKLGVHFFYETKSNLKREQVQLLADAGVTSVQPGIESFSGHVLQLMRKGVTPLQNVQLLKWCAEYGVKPQWNLLCGFPGEEARDYQDVLQFLEAISHLPPAEGWGWLRLDRFSPYFDFPDQFGVRIKGALEPYRHLYPLDASRLYNIAYFFEYDFDGKGAVEQRFQPLQAELSRWKETHQHAHLQVARRTDDEIVVRDTRYNRRSPGYRFREPEKAILDLIDTTHTFTAIHEHLVTRMNGAAPGEGWLHGFLDYLVRHRLVLRDGDRYLSVILPSERQEPEGW